jgi:hypothetical protein
MDYGARDNFWAEMETSCDIWTGAGCELEADGWLDLDTLLGLPFFVARHNFVALPLGEATKTVEVHRETF